MQSQGSNGGSALRNFVTHQRALAILLPFLAAVCLLVAYSSTQPRPLYILILDSGSTGTRIFAYTWKERSKQLPLIVPVDLKTAGHPVPRRQGGNTRAYDRVETEPGLDAYLNDPSGLKELGMKPLLQWAQEVIPQTRHKDTPVLLFATAGLRNLPKEQQSSMLGDIRDILHASPFRFVDKWAQIVTGEREGIYGWIALNYLSGYLSPHPFTASRSQSQATDAEAGLEELSEGKKVTAADASLKTVGALDLGGSSLEVTFMPMKISEDTVTANISILGVQYSLFTQTHNAHGLNSAFDQSVRILLEEPESLRDEENHVWGSNHAGLKSSKIRKKGNLDYVAGLQIAASKQEPQQLGKQAQILKSNVRSRNLLADTNSVELDHPCLHEGYRKAHRLEDGERASTVILVGRPNWRACDQLATIVVGSAQNCGQPPCALGTSQPLTTQPMFALTGFYVVYHFFGLPTSATLEELEKKGRRFCDTDWNAIASNRGSEVHVEHYCFRSLYVIKLLRQGLGLPEAQLRMGTGREDWTLGAALAEGGKIGAGLESQQALIPREYIFAALAVAVLLWGCFVTFVWQTSTRGLIERKSSGQVPSTVSSTGPGLNRQGLPPMPRNASLHSLQSSSRPPSQGIKPAVPQSPTSVVGGGDFNTNVARLSLSTQQRKRVSSIDDLTSLR